MAFMHVCALPTSVLQGACLYSDAHEFPKVISTLSFRFKNPLQRSGKKTTGGGKQQKLMLCFSVETVHTWRRARRCYTYARRRGLMLECHLGRCKVTGGVGKVVEVPPAVVVETRYRDFLRDFASPVAPRNKPRRRTYVQYYDGSCQERAFYKVLPRT